MEGPARGKFKLLAVDGSFVYKPPTNFVGVVSFRFFARDNDSGRSAVIRDTIRVG